MKITSVFRICQRLYCDKLKKCSLCLENVHERTRNRNVFWDTVKKIELVSMCIGTLIVNTIHSVSTTCEHGYTKACHRRILPNRYSHVMCLDLLFVSISDFCVRVELDWTAATSAGCSSHSCLSRSSALRDRQDLENVKGSDTTTTERARDDQLGANTLKKSWRNEHMKNSNTRYD